MSETVIVFQQAEAWRLVLLAAVVALAWACGFLGLRAKVSGRRRIWLLVLRGVGLLALALLLLGPALESRRLSALSSRLLILLDQSKSMALPSGEKGTRAQDVQRFLESQAAELKELERRFDLELRGFDTVLRAGRSSPNTSPSGHGTDLVKSLSEVLPREGAARDLAAVVLISDGADTEQLADFGPELPIPPAIATMLKATGVPINTVAVGDAKSLPDLAISDLQVDAFAFIRNAVEVEVEVSSQGLSGLSAPVTLEQGKRLLSSKTLSLKPGERRRIKLKIVPDRVGDFVFRVRVPLQPGEIMADNNERTFVLRVIRDKIRVLHLVGRPSWDQRFLRQVLKRNPNVDLISFFILRTLNDQTGVSQDELSLIPFPVAELFGKELPTFDLIIFQNFNHGPYRVSMYLPAIRQYVRQGGALLMLGGDLSFSAGGYAASPVEDVLPVRLQAGDDLHRESFRAVPSETGRHHPVLNLGRDSVFEHLPPLSAYHRALSLAPGAKALLVHPFAQAIDGPAPILAVREVERGRSAALLTDGAWRWNFVYAGQGGDPRPYGRLFDNLIRWLIRDPVMDPLQLEAESNRYEVGEPVRLAARVFDAGGQDRAWLSLLSADGEEVLERRSLDLSGGRVRTEFEGLAAGGYLARLELAGGSHAEEAFVVEGAGKELSRPRARPDILAGLAGLSGGKAFTLERASLDELALSNPKRTRIESSQSHPLLHRSWVLALLVACWALEWFLRRRWGLA